MWRKRSRPPQLVRNEGAIEAPQGDGSEREPTRSRLQHRLESPAGSADGFRRVVSQQSASEPPKAATTISDRAQRARRHLERAGGMEAVDGRADVAERAGHLMSQLTLKPDDSKKNDKFSQNRSPHKLIDKILQSSSSALRNSNNTQAVEQLQLQLAPSTNSSESLQRALFEGLTADHNLSSPQQQQLLNSSATLQQQLDQSAGAELDFFLPLFVLLVSINLIVILGNILVIVAVHANAKLRNVTNIFIVSLATADLLLGLFVLPYALVYEVLDVWVFGEIWCRGWLVTDVWISTASILNLCAISIDRYVAVTRPVKYRSIMTNRRAKCIVAIVWILAFIISLPPLLTELSPSSGQTSGRGSSSSLSPSSTLLDDNSPSSARATRLETTKTKPHNNELNFATRQRRSLEATASALIRPGSLESASWISKLTARNNAPNDAAGQLTDSGGGAITNQAQHSSNRHTNRATDQPPSSGHAGRQTMADGGPFSGPNSAETTRSDPSKVTSRAPFSRTASSERGQVPFNVNSRDERFELANAELSWRRFETSADSEQFGRSTSANSERTEPLPSGASSRPPLQTLEADQVKGAGLSFMGPVEGAEAGSATAGSVAGRGGPSPMALENNIEAKKTTTTATTTTTGREEIKLPFCLFIVLNENAAERFQVADDRSGRHDDDDDDAPHKSWRLSWSLRWSLNGPLECQRCDENSAQCRRNCLLLLVSLENSKHGDDRSNSTRGREAAAGARCRMRPAPLQAREPGQRHRRQPPGLRARTTRSLSDDDHFGGSQPRGQNPSVIDDNHNKGPGEPNGRRRLRRTNMSADEQQLCSRQLLQFVCQSLSLPRPIHAQVNAQTKQRKRRPRFVRSIPPDAIDCFGRWLEHQTAPVVSSWRRRTAELALERCCALIGKPSHRPPERFAFQSTGAGGREGLSGELNRGRVSSLLQEHTTRSLRRSDDNKVRLAELAHVSQDAPTVATANKDWDWRARLARGRSLQPAATATAAPGKRLATARYEESGGSNWELALGDFISNRKIDYAHEGARRDSDGHELARGWNQRRRRLPIRATETSGAPDSGPSRSWQAAQLDGREEDDLGRLIDELHFHCHSTGPARSCLRCISLLPPFELTGAGAEVGAGRTSPAPNGATNSKAPTSIGHVVLVLAAEMAPRQALAGPARGATGSIGRSLVDQEAAEDHSNSLAESEASSKLSGVMKSSRGRHSLAAPLGRDSERTDSDEGPQRRRGRIDNGTERAAERAEGLAPSPQLGLVDRSWPTRAGSRRDVKTGAAYSLGAISSLAGRAPAQSANDLTGTKAPKRAAKTFAQPTPLETNNEAATQLGRGGESLEQLWHNNNDDAADDDGDDINDYFAATRPLDSSKQGLGSSTPFGPVRSVRPSTWSNWVNSFAKLEQVAGSGAGPSSGVQVAAGEMQRSELVPDTNRRIQLNRTRRDIDSGDGAPETTEAKQARAGPRQKSGCALFHQKTYVVYSALGSFFIPMLVMVFFYSRIYLVALRAQKAMQRGYMTTKWPPLATNNNSNKQNAAQNNKRPSASQTNSSNSTRYTWSRASFKRSSLIQVGDGGEPTRSSRANSNENSPGGCAFSEARRISSREQELSSGLDYGAGSVTPVSQPERVTLRIHRRTEPPQQSNQSQSSQTPSFKALALKSAALIKSYNQQQQQQQQSGGAASRLRAISNESQSMATTVENKDNKSKLMRMIAIEQQLTLRRASNCQRQTRLSLDKGPGDGCEVQADENESERIASSQSQLATRKRSSLPPAIRITEAVAGQLENTTEIGIEVEAGKLSDGDKQTGEEDESSKMTTGDNDRANGDCVPSLAGSVDASDDRCRHRDPSHSTKSRHHLPDGAVHHHHHHHHHHQHHRHHHRHRHRHRHKHHKDCPSAKRANATSHCGTSGGESLVRSAANSIQITIENNDDEATSELENGSERGAGLQSEAYSRADSNSVPLRRTDRSQSQGPAVMPTIVVNWDPDSGQAASQVAQVSGGQLVQASMPILPLAPSGAVADGERAKSQLEATAAAMHQSLSGSGLSLVAAIPQQVRKQSMMLLSSITSRSGQTLRRLSMVAAHPVDSLLLKSRANSSTSGARGASKRRARHHNGRSERPSNSCSSSSVISYVSSASCRSSSLSGSSGTGLAAAADDDDPDRDSETGQAAEAHKQPARRRYATPGGRFASSSSEHEIGVDQQGLLFGRRAKAGRGAKSNESRRPHSAAAGSASPKKTLDDYLMAVAGIDNSSDEQYEDEEGQSDNSLTSSSSKSSSSSSSSSVSDLTSMLRKENLLIPTIAIVSPDGNGENRHTIQTIEIGNEQELGDEAIEKCSSSTKRRGSLRDRRASQDHIHHHQMEQQLESVDKQVRRTERLPPTAGLHRQGALYESATSRRQSQASSLSGGGAGEIGPRERAPIAVPAKLVNESNFSTGHTQSRSPDLFRLLDPKARRANAQALNNSNQNSNDNDQPKPSPATGATTTTRRRGLKRTSRWHAKRLRAETKAAKTVGIIVGGFICCWLPFFTAYLSRAIICSNPSCIPQTWLSLSIWLGYINSAINPVIYGLFSADFRQAFKSIVCRCALRSNQVQTPRHHHKHWVAAHHNRNHYHAHSTGHESAVLSTLADGILKSFL